MTDDFLVFDLETQRNVDQVGGWSNIADMKMSVGVVWDNLKRESLIFKEDQVNDLISLLLSGRKVIGFNHIKFDYVVLSGYAATKDERPDLFKKLSNVDNLDMLLDVTEILGHRLKLDSIAKATLGLGKSADGLMALKWWDEYMQTGDESKFKKIVDYCVQDVNVTRDVFMHGVNNKKVYFDSKAGVKVISVNWQEFLNRSAAQNSVREKKAEPSTQINLF